MRKLPRNKCLICGKETKRSTTKFCSRECYYKWRPGKKFSGPKIKHKEKPCLYCNKIFKPYRGTQKYCSLSCAGKDVQVEHMKKIGKAWKGIPKSEKQKKALSDFAKTRTGKKNPMYGKKAAHGKGEWHKTWDNQEVWTRSSWEKKYLELLDTQKIKYLVESKAFEITYMYEGKKKEGTYRPDVYLVEEDKYIEIKGFWRDDAKEKYEAMLEQYSDISIELLKKEELKKLGLNI